MNLKKFTSPWCFVFSQVVLFSSIVCDFPTSISLEFIIDFLSIKGHWLGHTFPPRIHPLPYLGSYMFQSLVYFLSHYFKIKEIILVLFPFQHDNIPYVIVVHIPSSTSQHIGFSEFSITNSMIIFINKISKKKSFSKNIF